jgi:methionine synthase II (cobalamin-independent)
LSDRILTSHAGSLPRPEDLVALNVKRIAAPRPRPRPARLVAERIARFADGVGPKSVVASTDCGLGGRIHPQVARAKLESLATGAELASRERRGRAAA